MAIQKGCYGPRRDMFLNIPSFVPEIVVPTSRATSKVFHYKTLSAEDTSSTSGCVFQTIHIPCGERIRSGWSRCHVTFKNLVRTVQQ